MSIQSARPRVTLQTRPLTRQGHACELGCPAYHGHDQKQPLVKETVVTGGSDCRENHAHDLKQKMSNGAEAQKRVRGSDAPQSSHRSQLRRWSSLPWSRYPRAARIFRTHQRPDKMNLVHGRDRILRQKRETGKVLGSSLRYVDYQPFVCRVKKCLGRHTHGTNCLDDTTHTNPVLSGHPSSLQANQLTLSPLKYTGNEL